MNGTIGFLWHAVFEFGDTDPNVGDLGAVCRLIWLVRFINSEEPVLEPVLKSLQ